MEASIAHVVPTAAARVSEENDKIAKDGVDAHVSQVSSSPELVQEHHVADFKKTWFGYLKTKQFWIVLVFG
jgi:hypothetical protein